MEAMFSQMLTDQIMTSDSRCKQMKKLFEIDSGWRKSA